MPVLILILLLLFSPPSTAADRYSVRFDESLEAVSVTACFDGKPPTHLVRHRVAARFTNWIRAGGVEMANPSQSHRLRLGALADGECLAWQVDLAAAVTQGDYRTALKSGDAVLTSGSLWFWRDDERRAIRVDVALPDGFAISAPWKEEWENGTRVFLPERTPAAWSSRIAVGHFAERRVAVGQAELRLAIVGRLSEIREQALTDWIRDTALGVASVSGAFPQQQPQFLLVCVGSQREAVPWAHVIRGGGIAVEFFIDETRPVSEFRSDWTATHEISHMLLPYVSSRDRWLSEGLASYYQNVLRARDGRLTETQAWKKLHAGFLRGERAAVLSLAEAPRSGWGTIMQVYWGGAAVLLKADTRLRSLSGGMQSLDTALSSLPVCCFSEGRAWRARELFEALDRATGYTVFMDLYRQEVGTTAFPELETTYAELGLDPRPGSLRLAPDAPLVQVRREIMAGPAGKTRRNPSPAHTPRPQP